MTADDHNPDEADLDEGDFEFDDDLFPTDVDPANRGEVVPGLYPTVLAWQRFAVENADVDKEWTELAKFVRWVVVRYELDSIPECWHLHGALVEELSALKSAHIASFDAGDSGIGPIGWHERFHLAQQRIKEWYRGDCRDGHMPSARKWAELGTDEWATWIDGGWRELIEPAVAASPRQGATA
ncbi:MULTISPECIES: hypothetical protein [unclassified Pseudoclavibacter]|uniref:hypothetical protein n=1 Tax=unclassified Pseudoclavibacter TaxID=2615177 RepID=UPI001BA59B27|nr:hypothetical protein [Pseudoclavibacter sp. Marseille-Q4354]MBS3177212.1 hypothetical protein [Pseudoclavibacter sp. Marseille-Q4354]